ncbi:MAG: DUF177 domain-containing protein [Alphaproteobacteria bacterium]|nr:DUF177 domain-containing protein [Alphaproteobacteria bacterium]
MNTTAPEFSRPVTLARIGSERFTQVISATPAECEALARRFGLLSLDRLTASVELSRRQQETILLQATFEAEFVQCSVVTLDPVPGRVSEQFSLRYGPPATEQLFAGEIGEENQAFEPLDGEAIDIGEAVAQEFSLALPQFPREPDATAEFDPEPALPESAFAALVALRPKP